MPPPSLPALFPVTLELLTVTVPFEFKIPPPSRRVAVLPLTFD